MAEIAYRQAGLDDAAEIHALLLALAPEIPLLVDTLEREEALYTLTRNCARSGESWVALNDASRIVGFLLIELNQARRHYAENEVLDLRYGGIDGAHRHQGIFAALVQRVLDRMLPVSASVSPANRSDVVRLLERLGFRRVSSPGGEQQFRCEPGAVPDEREQ